MRQQRQEERTPGALMRWSTPPQTDSAPAFSPGSHRSARACTYAQTCALCAGMRGFASLCTLVYMHMMGMHGVRTWMLSPSVVTMLPHNAMHSPSPMDSSGSSRIEFRSWSMAASTPGNKFATGGNELGRMGNSVLSRCSAARNGCDQRPPIVCKLPYPPTHARRKAKALPALDNHHPTEARMHPDRSLTLRAAGALRVRCQIEPHASSRWSCARHCACCCGNARQTNLSGRASGSSQARRGPACRAIHPASYVGVYDQLEPVAI